MINTINTEYAKACTEVLAIISNMSIENFKKIPKELLKCLEENKDSEYNFQLDYSKSLNEQNISKFTTAILRNIYRDYWASEDVKQKILLDEANKRYESEKIKRELYNPDNIFKNINKSNSRQQNTTAITITKEDSILKKILDKIKNMWRKKSEK